MKHLMAAGLCLILAGCAQAPEPRQRPVFRDTAAQIASQTDVTADRMAGDWVIRQRYVLGLGATNAFQFRLRGDGALLLVENNQFCDQDLCGDQETTTLMLPTGPGRWQTANPSGSLPEGEIWIMWMDFDSRTAAIGTPSGEFGWIMDKRPTGGADRITAAREIMDWFGYDTSRLESVRR